MPSKPSRRVVIKGAVTAAGAAAGGLLPYSAPSLIRLEMPKAHATISGGGPALPLPPPVGLTRHLATTPATLTDEALRRFSPSYDPVSQLLVQQVFAHGRGALNLIDPTTGAVVRTFELSDPQGIVASSVDPITGEIYALTNGGFGKVPDSLVVIDPQGTGITRTVQITLPANGVQYTIVADPSSDRVYLNLEEAGGWSSDIIAIDSKTGTIESRRVFGTITGQTVVSRSGVVIAATIDTQGHGRLLTIPPDDKATTAFTNLDGIGTAARIVANPVTGAIYALGTGDPLMLIYGFSPKGVLAPVGEFGLLPPRDFRARDVVVDPVTGTAYIQVFFPDDLSTAYYRIPQ